MSKLKNTIPEGDKIVTTPPADSVAELNTSTISARAVTAEITAIVRGDLNAEGDGLGGNFVRTAGGSMYTYDVSQPVDVGDFVVHLGEPALGVRFFARRAAAVALGIVAE